MKALKTIFISAIAVITVACGSVQTKTSDQRIDGEAILVKRHLNQLQVALNHKNSQKARTHIKILQSLWQINDQQTFLKLKAVLKPDQLSVLYPSQTKKPAIRPQPTRKSDTKHRADSALKNLLIEFGEDPSFDVPPQLQAEVYQWIKVMTASQARDQLQASLQNMNSYFPMISKTFAKRGIPDSLAFIALIESGYQPNIRAKNGNVGLWQFSRKKAKRYGLKVNNRVDQRKNPKQATIAAREYLLDLILEFGDGHSMLLAIAAYHAGENKIRARLRKLNNYQDRSFWTLASRNLISQQTKEYVLKVIAAGIIVKHASRYGLSVGPALAKINN